MRKMFLNKQTHFMQETETITTKTVTSVNVWTEKQTVISVMHCVDTVEKDMEKYDIETN